MKKTNLALIVFALIFSACTNEINKNPETEKEKASYALGVNFAETANGVIPLDSIDIDLLQQGLNDFFEDTDLLIEKEECLPIIQGYISKIQTAKQEAGKNELNKWLSDSTKIIDTKVTLSGLKYEIIKNGEGEKPTENDNVSVHYYGSLTDGTKFDSSFDRGEPTSFPVSGVIPGWTEALLLMNIGSKWKLTIPANLAYGEKGAGAIIPPNSDLIFIVELMAINK